METSQKNNYKNEHIASKKALSATGIVTLIVAAVSFYAGSLFGENSVLNMSLFILGIALGIFGFIKIFMGEKVFYHKETGTKLRFKRLTFSKNERNRLEKILQEKKFRTNRFDSSRRKQVLGYSPRHIHQHRQAIRLGSNHGIYPVRVSSNRTCRRI